LIYKNITLITSTDIIKQIFTLVCNKLSLNLEIYPNDINIKKTDILIYEDIIYNKNEIIRYKSMCSVLAVIAKQKVYEYEGCYLIKKPFLPSALVNNISELIDSVSTIKHKQIPSEINSIDEMDELSLENNKLYEDDNFDINSGVDDLVDFIDNIEDIKDEEQLEDEDIIIKKSDLGHGGVLDQKELSNLHNIISDNDIKGSDILEELSSEDKKNDDWLELNDIIDDVIDDISSETIKEENNNILLVLNKFTMDDLSPLLNKLDQDAIDKISIGKDLNITLRLEK